VEKAFIANNPQSALRLGEARGVILLAAAQFGIDLHEYTPAEVKTAITGHGRASKEEVQRMVCRLLGYPGLLPEDEADALGTALSCLYRRKFDSAVSTWEQQGRGQASRRSHGK
jgi:crossover junction endodeoxyribonuclease RuvC